ncbi:MAG: SDR family NAD(P)-dependent oxidoreductase [Hyphomonadaceae bacterium]
MPLNFNGQTAVIVGATTDLGAALAAFLRERGATVHADDASTALTDTGHRALIERAAAESGRIDILATAREADTSGDFARTSDVEFADQLRTHLQSVFWALRAAIPKMRAAGYGRILTCISSLGAFGAGGDVGVAAAHAGVIALMKSAAAANRDLNLRVNALASIASTHATAAFFDDHPQLDRSVFALNKILPAASYLCHADCSQSGQVFSAGGDRFAKLFTGATLGAFLPGLSDDAFAAALEEIGDRQTHLVPASMADELILVPV